jgi:hypothetical protein
MMIYPSVVLLTWAAQDAQAKLGRLCAVWQDDLRALIP